MQKNKETVSLKMGIHTNGYSQMKEEITAECMKRILQNNKDETLIFNGDFNEVIKEISKMIPQDTSTAEKNKSFFPFVPDLRIEVHGIYTAIWVKGKFISENTSEIEFKATPCEKTLFINTLPSAFEPSGYDLICDEKIATHAGTEAASGGRGFRTNKNQG